MLRLVACSARDCDGNRETARQPGGAISACCIFAPLLARVAAISTPSIDYSFFYFNKRHHQPHHAAHCGRLPYRDQGSPTYDAHFAICMQTCIEQRGKSDPPPRPEVPEGPDRPTKPEEKQA
jgi:hypothetical protein